MNKSEIHSVLNTGKMISGAFIKARKEIWIEFLNERLTNKRVDRRTGLYVIKGDQTLFTIHKHPHLLHLLS